MGALDERCMQPIENAILELRSIRRVEIRMAGARVAERYTAVVAEWARTVLPRLHNVGVLV